MKKTYVAPELFVEEFVADTMIASSGGSGIPKVVGYGDDDCYPCVNSGTPEYDSSLGYWIQCSGAIC